MKVENVKAFPGSGCAKDIHLTRHGPPVTYLLPVHKKNSPPTIDMVDHSMGETKEQHIVERYTYEDGVDEDKAPASGEHCEDAAIS